MIDKNKLIEVMGRDAYADMTGVEVIRAEPGYAEAVMKVVPSIVNGHGNVQGGALFTLADYTAAVASNMFGTATTAVDCSISFLSMVREGHVTAKARTVKKGSRMTFQVVELFRSDGELVAIFQGGAIAVPRRTKTMSGRSRAVSTRRYLNDDGS